MTTGTDLTTDVVTRLQGISKAAGYLTDIGGSVFRGSADQIINEATQLPAALVRTSSDNVVSDRPGKAKRERTVMVEAYVHEDGDYEPTLDDIANDIYRAISPATHGEQINRESMEVRVGGFDFDHPKPGERFAVISTQITLTYVETYS